MADNPLLPAFVQANNGTMPGVQTAYEPPAPRVQPTTEQMDHPLPGEPESSLPLVYHAAAQARAAGYSWDQINDRLAGARGAATAAGYSDADVDKAFGLSPSQAREPPPSDLPWLNVHPDAADSIRQFAAKYLTPRSEYAATGGETPPLHTAGDLARMVGWDITDVGKMFGAQVANGLSAMVEGLHGQYAPTPDAKGRMDAEVQLALGFLGGGFAEVPGAAKLTGPAALRAAVPTVESVLDAATSIAKAHPDGLTADTLTSTAQVLGQHFIDTGETPLATVSRAASDPETMAAIHEAAMPTYTLEKPESLIDTSNMTKGQFVIKKADGTSAGFVTTSWDAATKVLTVDNVEAYEGAGSLGPRAIVQLRRQLQQEYPEATKIGGLRVSGARVETGAGAAETEMALHPLSPDTLLDEKGIEAASIEAVRHPGLIPDPEPIGASNATAFQDEPRPNPAFRLPPLGGPLINPETIGQANAVLGKGLLTSFRRVFSVQSLDRPGAGVIRHWLADTQAGRIRSTENLRRFGRAVGDTSSADRRAWWHAFEGGEEVPLQATDLAGQAQEMLGRAGLPPGVTIHIQDIPSPRPGVRTAGYYRPALRQIVIDAASDRVTIAHEISHAIYDKTNNMLTPEQRALMDVRANRWLNQAHAPGVTNRDFLKALGYPDHQMTEEGMARLIGENMRVTNARDALERYKGTPLGDMGAELRKELDARYLEMDKLGIAPTYIENYLPRIYQDPIAVGKIFGKRPMEGSKTFTRQRVFEYLMDAEDAGMKLATDNPVETTLIRLHDMDKFINYHNMIQELDLRGMGQWVKLGERAPAGLARTSDIIRNKTNPGAVFWAPEPIAVMLNRHLSPGISAEPIYEVLRQSTAMITSLKLMLSAFHPLYMSGATMASAFGLGLKQVFRGGVGNMVSGVGRMLASPAAPFQDFFTGKSIINYAKTGIGSPKTAMMYDAMIASGARFMRSEIYQSSAAGSFFNSIKGSVMPSSGLLTFSQDVAAMLRNAPPVMIGNVQVAPSYLRAMAQAVPRVIDTLTEPIMGQLVPMMKAGAMARRLQEMMVAHPGMGLEDMRVFGGRISDHMDNLVGQVVQDNLFWNTTLQQGLNVVFMAPQWFLGKLRILSGAATDLLGSGGFVKGAEGSRELSDNITTLVGWVAASVFTGALYGYFKGTWNKDWTLRDYMAPPTGGQDKQGGPERIMLPGMERDVYGWEQNPEQELLNKVNSLWGAMGELATNTQFNGAAITDPAGTLQAREGDYAKFIAHQLEPLAWQEQPLPEKETQIDYLTRVLGGREAPFGIREPELQEKYYMRATKKKVNAKDRQDQERDEQ